VRVAGAGNPDAVSGDDEVLNDVVGPVSDYLDGLAAEVLATSEVGLDGRGTAARSRETNAGNLVADALLWEAGRLAEEFDVEPPQIALQNGGGIRNESVVPAGEITELTTYEMLPFASFVSVVEGVCPPQLKLLLENAVSEVEDDTGRFAQVAGFRFRYDMGKQPAEYDLDGALVQEGERVREASLSDGSDLIVDGEPVEGGPCLSVATIDFLARGGDQYPFGEASFTNLGVSYQQALRNYLVEGLGGVVTATDYPEGGEGRIRQGLTRTLFEGWNGFPYWGPEVSREGIEAALTSFISPPGTGDAVARYDEAQASWLTHYADAPLPAFNNLDALAPGLEYWFFVSSDAQLDTAPEDQP
jgi:5'-nucleotidase